MSTASHSSISRLLHAWSAGREDALDEVLRRAQRQLRRQASAFLSRERRAHTLQPTALVNEAFLRLVRQRAVRWSDRRHFFAVAAMSMRRVLVDAARRRGAQRRGMDPVRVSLASADAAEEPDLDLLDLHRALDQLAALDTRQAQIVTLRYFGGLSVPDVAELLGVSISTVESDWRMARAWLRCRLRAGTGSSPPAGER